MHFFLISYTGETKSQYGCRQQHRYHTKYLYSCVHIACPQCQQPQPQTLRLQPFSLYTVGCLINPKKPKEIFNLQKNNSVLPRYIEVFYFSNISDTLFNQESPLHRELGFPGEDKQTNMVTYRLNQPRNKFSEKVTHIIQKV